MRCALKRCVAERKYSIHCVFDNRQHLLSYRDILLITNRGSAAIDCTQ